MPSSISSSRTLAEFPWPSRACVAAVGLFLAARLFFAFQPDFFNATPESATEYYFYTNDLALKVDKPEAQIVVQGTSRSMAIDLIPIGARRWHTRDRLYNVSRPLNTWWQMAAILRRNPDLLRHADLWLIDVLPFQARWGHGLRPTDRLFLRESTLREKWLVDSPLDRLLVLFDAVVPAWSNSHTVANWWRATKLARSDDAARLEHLLSGGYRERYADREELNIMEQMIADPDEARRSFVSILYDEKKTSRVQLDALRSLLDARPAQTHLLFFHGPFNAEFAAIATEERLERGREEMSRMIGPLLSDHVHMIWMQSAAESGLSEDDFHLDGVHLNETGMAKATRSLAQWYRSVADGANDED